MSNENRMMDPNTFQELLDAGELGLILMDGGKNLTPKQMRQVKEKAKEQVDEAILKKQMELAKQPGYANSVLVPLIKKVLEQSGITNALTSGSQVTKTEAKPSQNMTVPTSEGMTKVVAVKPKIKAVAKLKNYTKKFIEKDSKKSAESLSAITDIVSFFDFIREDSAKMREHSEDFQKELNSDKQKKHKEIMDIIISATKNKVQAEKKIKKSIKEKKKEKPEEKKKEKPEEKKEEAKPPTKPAEKPSEAPAKTEAPKVSAPKPTAQQVPGAPQVPTAKPSLPALPKPSLKAVTTGGLLTAAALSVRGETGAKSIENVGSDAKKVGQVVQNDPKPGVSSYGIFGINSGGSVQKFVADNPQFNLAGQPGTKEFDESWKKVANEKTNEFYQAQLNWYDKYVYQPVKTDMQKLLPANLGADDKIVTYMADRRNQMGKVLEQQAIAYAKDAKTPEEFVIKISEHDISDENIRKAFPTYIKTHGEKNIPGLKKRVELRKQLSLQVQSDVGEKISDNSINNAEMKKIMRQGSSQQVIIQQNVNNLVSKQPLVMSPKKQELNPTMQ